MKWTILDSNHVDQSGDVATSCDDCEVNEPLRAAPGAALLAEIDPEDTNLAFLIESWPSLPPHVRRDVLAIIQNAMK